MLWKHQGSQTEYAIRAFPLGGFVGFPDDDPDCAIPPNDPNLLRNRPILDRAIVISAGVIANLIFAYLVLILQLGIVGVPDYQPGVIVKPINQESLAYQAGIREGDIVLAVNGQVLPTAQAAMNLLSKEIQNHPHQEIELKIQHDNQDISLKVTPKQGDDGKGVLGIGLTPNGKPVPRHLQNPLEILNLGASRFQELFLGTVKGFGQLITNFQQTAGQVSVQLILSELVPKSLLMIVLTS